jgi:hypothetical protein
MKSRSLAVAVLFLALAGYLYFVEKPRHHQEAEQKKLLRFKPDDVSEVVLTYPDKRIVGEKTGASAAKPIDAGADQSAVQISSARSPCRVKRTLEGDAGVSWTSARQARSDRHAALSNGKALPSIRIGKAAPVASRHTRSSGSTGEGRSFGPSDGHEAQVKDLRDRRSWISRPT